MIKKWFDALLIEETNDTKIQFFRSLFVGGIATVADIGVMILFRELFKMSETLAAVFGFIAGLTVNYIISTFWVFSKAKVKNRTADFIAFGVIGLIGLGINELIIAPFAVQGIFGEGILYKKEIFGSLIPADKYYIVGKMIATVVAYMWNFFARKFILYRNVETDEPAAE